jgi:hypothetical protein
MAGGDGGRDRQHQGAGGQVEHEDTTEGPSLAEQVQTNPAMRRRAQAFKARRRAEAAKAPPLVDGPMSEEPELTPEQEAQREAELEQQKHERAKEIWRRQELINKLYALQHGLKYTPDADAKPPSYWREVWLHIKGNLIDPWSQGDVAAWNDLKSSLRANAIKSNEMREQMKERGTPLGMTFTPIAVGIGDTVKDINSEIQACTDAIERSLEAQRGLDKAIALLEAGGHMAKAAAGAYALAEPVGGITRGGGAAGGMSIASVSGGGEAALARTGTATATAGMSSPLPRLIAGLGADVGHNPAAEDKSLHEGDAKEQQKAEKKDARDAEPGARKKPSAGDRTRSAIAEHIPAAGETFNDWFDALTPKELAEYLADKSSKTTIGARELIEEAIRHPGDLHEWLMVKHVLKFKEWSVSMRVIKSARTLTEETMGKAFKHGGAGSGTMHNQLSRMIDSSASFAEFLEKLNAWADDALYAGKGLPGRQKLPPELQR